MKQGTLAEMALIDGRVLEVSVSYSKGGANFFNGNNERRGYSLHLSPVKLEQHDGWVSRSFTISGDVKDRGLKSFLLEVARQSPKAEARAVEIAKSRLNRVLNEWLSRSGCAFVEPIQPHSIVNYSELPTILLSAQAPTPSAPERVPPASAGQVWLRKEDLARLPALGAQDGAADAVAYVKYFDPTGSWTWYATEYDPQEGRFFGLVVGAETELGYFTLTELKSVRGRMGLGIERDRHFTPMPLSGVRALHHVAA